MGTDVGERAAIWPIYIKVGDHENREYSRECGGMTGAEKPRRSAFSFLSYPHCQNFPAHPKNFIF